MAVNLKDIAEQVGVSVQVVSKVLNGGSATVGASPTTRRQVIETAQKLGYRRHAAGSALRKKAFKSIGLLMGGPEHEIFLPQRLLSGITRTLCPRDYTCCLVSAGALHDEDSIDKQRILAENMVDALIIGYSQDPPQALLAAVKRLKLPVVWLHRQTRYNAVAHDEGRAAEILVDHLADQGHRAITYIDYNGLRPGSASNRDRLAGLYAACERRGVTPTLMNDRRVERPDRAAYTRAWLSRKDRPSAIIVDSCSAAQVILSVTHQNQIAVPDRLAIATFDNGYQVTANDPMITSAIVPEEAIGVAAAELALALAEGRGKPVSGRLIEPTLIIGGTTVPTTKT